MPKRRKQTIPFVNFGQGINAVPGFFGSRNNAKDILNYDIDDDGFLIPRLGTKSVDLTILFDSVGARNGAEPNTPANPANITLYSDQNAGNPVIARWYDKGEREEISRLYFMPEGTWTTPVRNGRILLITEPDGNYFIDIRENIRHEWKLTSPKISNNPQIFSPELDQLRRKIVAEYITNPDNALLSDFPYASQTAGAIERNDLALFGWRAVYENPELVLQSFSEEIFVSLGGILTTQFLNWLHDGDITFGGTRYPERFKGMLAAGMISSQENDLIENTYSHRTFTFDLSDAPTWATQLSIYRGELPETVLMSEDLESIPRSATTYEVTSIIGGTIAVLAGTFTANPVAIKVGAALVISGIGSISAGDTDVELKQYTLDKDAVASVPDDVYERWHIEDIRTPLQQRKSNPALADEPYPVTFDWEETNRGDVYLDTQYNLSPPDNMTAMTKHAGRIYAVDRDTQEVIFSHIDGNGISQWLAFPLQNRISTEDSGQAEIIALERMPDRGGIYVFKRDAIHFIDGKNIFSGLYDIDIGTTTDISAAASKPNLGCISPKSIANNGTVVVFVGSDDQIYTMTGKSATPIGVRIKPLIQELTLEQQENISTTLYKERFYITLTDSTLILDTERKYWLRFDWILDQILWDRGGRRALSKLYGRQPDNTFLELNVPTEDTFPQVWEANKQITTTGGLITAVYVYTENEAEITVEITGNEPAHTIERTFTPALNNKYRCGVHIKGRILTIKITSKTPIAIDRIMLGMTI